MSRRDEVDGVTLGVLSIITVLSSLVFFLPRTLAHLAGRDAWLAAVTGTPLAVLVTGAWVKLYFRPGLTPLDRVRHHRWWAAAVRFLLTVYAAYHAGGILSEAVFLLAIVYPETPTWVFHLGLGGTALVLAGYGRETIGRVGLVLLPLMILTLGVNFLILLPASGEWVQLLPMLEHGIGPVVATMPFTLAAAAETVVLTFLADGLGTPQRRRIARVLAASVIVQQMLLAVVVAVCVAALGPGETARSLAPTLTVSRLARPIPLLARPEVFTLSAWLLGITIKVALFVYVTGVLVRDILGLDEGWQPLAHGVAAAVATAIATTLFGDASRWQYQFQWIWPVVGAGGFLAALLPALVPRSRRT